MKKEQTPMQKAIEMLLEDKTITSGKDANDFISTLAQEIIQTLMDKEFEMHMDYTKSSHRSKKDENRRNGFVESEDGKGKKVKTAHGEIKVKIPRDRDGEFEPKIVPKRIKILDGIEDAVIEMYACGNSLNDIKDILKNLYKIDLSTDYLSQLTASVSEKVTEWQSRELEAFYAITYVDCIYAKVKHDLVSENTPIYVIIGINKDGKKDVLGFYVSNETSESATYWGKVLEDIKTRGVKDILFMCFDGLAGLDNIVETYFPDTITQRCIVHITRNLYKRCNKKEAKETIGDFKKIYTCANLEEAKAEYKNFIEKYADKKQILKYVAENINHVFAIFDYPSAMRKLIYTTNAIESVNSCLRKVTRGKGSFINAEALNKVIYLRINKLTEKWSK
ncbi:MAG: IS256 family transposase, partial [Clostridia bacterium]